MDLHLVQPGDNCPACTSAGHLLSGRRCAVRLAVTRVCIRCADGDGEASHARAAPHASPVPDPQGGLPHAGGALQPSLQKLCGAVPAEGGGLPCARPLPAAQGCCCAEPQPCTPPLHVTRSSMPSLVHQQAMHLGSGNRPAAKLMAVAPAEICSAVGAKLPSRTHSRPESMWKSVPTGSPAAAERRTAAAARVPAGGGAAGTGGSSHTGQPGSQAAGSQPADERTPIHALVGSLAGLPSKHLTAAHVDACSCALRKTVSLHGARSFVPSQAVELPDMQSGLHMDMQTLRAFLHGMPCRQVATSYADLFSSRVCRSWVLSRQDI